MTDTDHVAAAHAREQRAREREARALAHERAAEHAAQIATDPDTARAYLSEAETHARAVEVHRRAIEVQAKHARQHES